jgi:hypothetical protein
MFALQARAEDFDADLHRRVSTTPLEGRIAERVLLF